MDLSKNYKLSSDEKLMAVFQSGKDERSFNELYRRYSKRLLHFMYNLLNNDEPLAQDKLHDVFARIIQKPELFDVTRNFKTWVFMVAANECKKHYRKEPTSSMEDVLDSNFTVSNELIQRMDENQFKKDLKAELKLLSFTHRSTFVMRFQEQMSVREISVIMDCSEGTVKSRTHHCLKILAKKLAIYNPMEL